MHDEVMAAGTQDVERFVSKLTLAAFQDSGWYNVDLNKGYSVYMGQGSGCKYLFDRCINMRGTAETPDFCAFSGNKLCDPTLTAKGNCEKATYTSFIPPEFRYFSQPNLGGADSEIEFCPVVRPMASEACYQPLLTSTNDFGESFGVNARCITGNLHST
jgi:leishmanolysin